MIWRFDRESRRRRMLERVEHGPLRDFLSVAAPQGLLRDIRLVALDLETSGLRPGRDEIISVGIVELVGGRIDLGSAQQWLVRPQRRVGAASVAIHHITDDDVAAASPLKEVLNALLPRLAGSALLGHNIGFDLRFLNHACRRLYRAPLPISVVDTQRLALRQLQRGERVVRPEELRLAKLRQRYHLPSYPAHDALSDALACAELFLALSAEQGLQERSLSSLHGSA